MSTLFLKKKLNKIDSLIPEKLYVFIIFISSKQPNFVYQSLRGINRDFS